MFRRHLKKRLYKSEEAELGLLRRMIENGGTVDQAEMVGDWDGRGSRYPPNVGCQTLDMADG